MGKVDEWIEWLHHAELDIRGLLLSRIVYRELAEMVRANPVLQRPSHFYDFLARTYADHLASPARRRQTHALAS